MSLIFHPGSHVGQGVEAGITYISDMLNSILTPTQTTTVLLETMAGKGSEDSCRTSGSISIFLSLIVFPIMK